MNNLTHDENPKTQPERRGFTRLGFTHRVRWAHSLGDHGEALVRNVSRGGLCISLAQYFRPGHLVEFTFDDILFRRAPVRFEALITWCRPVPSNPERFDIGFRIIYDTGEKVAAVSELVYRALEFRAPTPAHPTATLDRGCYAH